MRKLPCSASTSAGSPHVGRNGFVGDDFPFRDRTINYTKERVRLQWRCTLNCFKPRRRAHAQFVHEMRPLVLELASRDDEQFDITASADFPGVEAIAAPIGFEMYGAKIGGDMFARRCRLGKAGELRMIPVAARQAGEHGLCKQGFAPKGNKAFGVEVSRVEGPESHDQ